MMNWLKCAVVRAIKTFAQTAVSLVTVGAAFTEVQWLQVVSISGVAALLSLLTSIAGLPECKEQKELPIE